MSFTVEEINFVCIALGKTRAETVSNIFEMLPDIHDSDMKIIAERVIGKLEKITDEEYAEFNFLDNFAEV